MIDFTLGPVARARGFRVMGHERVGSTNTEAMLAARSGELDRLWIAAPEQTDGRGRRGRNWASQYGNLAASLYVALPDSVAEPGILGFVAGVSLARAIEGVVGNTHSQIELKWPNDVLAGSAKLVGILLEAERLPDRRLGVIVGMGVNIVAVPPDLPYVAVSLNELGVDITAQQVFTALGETFADTFDVWNYGEGNADIMQRWRLYAAGIGGRIGVQLDGRSIEGRFETVDEQGRLIVRSDDGTLERVTAGDVYFGSARSARNNDELRERG